MGKQIVPKIKISMHGIRRRWLLNSLTLSLALVLFGVAFYSLGMASFYYTSLQSSLESRATATANYFSKYITTGYDDYYNSAYRFALDFEDNDKLEVQFINSAGRVEVSTARQTVGFSPQTDDIADAIKNNRVKSWMGLDPLTDEHVLSVSAPLFYKGREVIGVMRYVTSLSEANNRILISLVTSIIFGVLIIAFTVFTNLYFIGTIVAPVQEITHIAKKISGGSFGAMIEKKYDDEIGELADTINNMSSEIAGYERMKTDFISAVSHELRTPLTAITGWGEVLISSDESNLQDIHKGIRIILKETNRLNKLVEELLDFTRVESGRMIMLFEPFDIASELEEVVFMYMDSLSEAGVTLNYEPPDSFPEITGDRSRIRQVFLNIMENAVRHGGDGKRIDVTLEAREYEAVVTFRDYGQGIAEDELPLIKRKFYRGSTKARGTGIGLAISDEIIHMHDGHIEICSELGNGTAVAVHLPVKMGADWGDK